MIEPHKDTVQRQERFLKSIAREYWGVMGTFYAPDSDENTTYLGYYDQCGRFSLTRIRTTDHCVLIETFEPPYYT